MRCRYEQGSPLFPGPSHSALTILVSCHEGSSNAVFPTTGAQPKKTDRSSFLFPLLHSGVVLRTHPGFSFQETNTGFVLTNLAQLGPRILLYSCLCPLNLCVSGIPLPRILQNSQPVHSGLSLFMVIVLVAATSRMLFPLYCKGIRFLHMLPFHALDLIETCILISCRWM